MISRDQYGIIVQHPTMDGGDSCARTGIAALEIDLDKEKLQHFVGYDGELVRHPYQKEYNDPKKTSRDNVVQFFVAVKENIIARKYAEKWWVNDDFLDPSVKLYLYKCSDQRPPLWLSILGTIWMFLSLIWNTMIKTDEEKNQFTCMCLRYGDWWCQKLYDWHPDIEANIRDYWDGWRDQPEIGNILLNELMIRNIR